MIKNFIQLNARYLSNLSTTFISQAVSALSILLLTPILLQQLGTTQYSQYGVLVNMILFSAIFDLGLNIGLLRKLIHNHPNNLALINTIFFFFVGSLCLLAPLFWILFSVGFVKVESNFYYLSFFVSIIVIQNFLALFFDNIIQSANKIYVGRIIRMIRTGIEALALWWVAYSGSILYLFITTALINTVYLFFLFAYAKKEFDFYLSWANCKWSLILEHIQYSFWYFQSALAGAIVFNAQIVLISSIAPPTQVTHYLLITRFYDVIRAGLTNFVGVMFPSLSKSQANQDWAAIARTYQKVVLRFVGLAILVMLFSMSIGQYFFKWWSDVKDADALMAFNCYGILLGLLLIENVPNVFLAALKKNKWPSVVSTIQGLIGLALTYFFLPIYGITGAIISLITAFLFTSGWFNFVFMRQQLKQHLK